MLETYFPVAVFILVGVVFGVASIVAGRIIAPHKPDGEKLAAYECGFDAFGDARGKFDVRYYLVAILFILFDLEVAFLVPWAVIFKEIANAATVRWFGFLEMLVFIAILVVGYIYARAKGALDWE
ncbi:MAG: NADH-quinone oxidoreductase subunit A [Candidatus Accumulibacter sp.]|jgi:NADH-quinone oxidoreductase subunit A|nr:NADH-quinone oxidoreductase subunit A [Accumulibacter sp.]